MVETRSFSGSDLLHRESEPTSGFGSEQPSQLQVGRCAPAKITPKRSRSLALVSGGLG